MPDESTVLDDSKDVALVKVQKWNEATYTDLLLACEEETAFGLVEEAVTIELPSGSARRHGRTFRTSSN